MTEVRIPVPMGPNDTVPPKEFAEWPKWFTGPNGQRQVFKAAHEVPDGWTDLPPASAGVSAPSAEPDYGYEEQDEEQDEDEQEAEEEAADADDAEGDVIVMTAEQLVDSHTHAELVAILEKAPKDSVEYLESWPKPKLAATIVEAGLSPKAEQE